MFGGREKTFGTFKYTYLAGKTKTVKTTRTPREEERDVRDRTGGYRRLMNTRPDHTVAGRHMNRPEKQEAAVTYECVPRWRRQRLLWVMTTRGRPRWGGGSILNLTRGFARSKPFAAPSSPPPSTSPPRPVRAPSRYFGAYPCDCVSDLRVTCARIA